MMFEDIAMSLASPDSQEKALAIERLKTQYPKERVKDALSVMADFVEHPESKDRINVLIAELEKKV